MDPSDSLPSVVSARRFAERWFTPGFIQNELRSLLTDDFTRSDRRRLIGVPGDVGPQQFVDQQMSFVNASRDQPTVEVVEVLGTRGDRYACTRNRIVYPEGYTSEIIVVGCLDAAAEKWSRLVIFDSDDDGAAVEELERLAAEPD